MRIANEGFAMPKTLDRHDLMQLFVRIVDTQSISAAGRLMGLSQPAASRRLRMLEDMLGVRDRKSTRLNSSHALLSRMPSSA